MERVRICLSFLLLTFCTLGHGVVASPVTIRLGFLLPYPSGDGAVSAALADEWITAVKVALDVLARKYESTFNVLPFVENSNCNQEDAQRGAKHLLESYVVGVVGPACSEAVVGAALVLNPARVPFVSFAATADLFRDGEEYYTFFRTVFGDRHQSAAIQSVINFFQWQRVHIFHTTETYGTALGYDIQKRAMDANLHTNLIAVPTSSSDYKPYFNDQSGGGLITTSNDTIVVFATTPNAAAGLWTAALELDMMAYPWWYLGADGAVAYNPVGQGDQAAVLTNALQGQLGVSPWKGDYDPSTSTLNEFLDYWKQQSYSQYPGLINFPTTPPIDHTQAYVPYLIDAVWAFFEAFNKIITEQEKAVTSDLILQCFYDVIPGCINFHGASGPMGFNTTTGERRKDVTVPMYSVVNLVGMTWEPKADWSASEWAGFTVDTKYLIARPGPVPPNVTGTLGASSYQLPTDLMNEGNIDSNFDNIDKEESEGGGGMSGVELALIILGCILGAGLIVVGIVWFVRRRNRKKLRFPDDEFVVSNGFARMI